MSDARGRLRRPPPAATAPATRCNEDSSADPVAPHPACTLLFPGAVPSHLHDALVDLLRAARHRDHPFRRIVITHFAAS